MTSINIKLPIFILVTVMKEKKLFIGTHLKRKLQAVVHFKIL